MAASSNPCTLIRSRHPLSREGVVRSIAWLRSLRSSRRNTSRPVRAFASYPVPVVTARKPLRTAETSHVFSAHLERAHDRAVVRRHVARPVARVVHPRRLEHELTGVLRIDDVVNPPLLRRA